MTFSSNFPRGSRPDEILDIKSQHFSSRRPPLSVAPFRLTTDTRRSAESSAGHEESGGGAIVAENLERPAVRAFQPRYPNIYLALSSFLGEEVAASATATKGGSRFRGKQSLVGWNRVK